MLQPLTAARAPSPPPRLAPSSSSATLPMCQPGLATAECLVPQSANASCLTCGYPFATDEAALGRPEYRGTTVAQARPSPSTSLPARCKRPASIVHRVLALRDGRSDGCSYFRRPQPVAREHAFAGHWLTRGDARPSCLQGVSITWQLLPRTALPPSLCRSGALEGLQCCNHLEWSNKAFDPWV